MPTYFTTTQSKAYILSKKLLASGSLDDALSTLEMTLQLSRQMLANSIQNDDEIEMHESLAPLYYLYGTTLLYSVEESDVMMANNQQTGAAAVDMEVTPEEEESPQNDNGEEGGAAEPAVEVADTAEDLQIAWENLDLARTITSRLVSKFHDEHDDGNNSDNVIVYKSEEKETPGNNDKINNSIDYSPTQQTSLLLDLAQIHTRLGDLQRANDNILPCIDDYNLALQLRRRCLGQYDRKVADAHFSLAGVYAEAPNRVNETEGQVDRFVGSLGGTVGGGGGDGNGMSEEEKKEFRRRSLEHYLACGVAFAGVMAGMCGEDAETLTKDDNDDVCDTPGVAMAASAASSATNQSANHHSKMLEALRNRVSSLQPPTSEKDREEFLDLKEMLDEIQEAMDSAEETEEGLKSLGEMKANEIKKHDMKQNGNEGVVVEETTEGGATTTIGFGPAISSSSGFGAASAANTVNAFGAASAIATTTASTAPTMMVVKKKKKKPQAADDSAKRMKSN